jgi:hypothetical protein
MEFFQNPAEIISFSSTLLFLLLSANRTLDLPTSLGSDEEAGTLVTASAYDPFQPSFDVDVVTRAALHNFRICNIFFLLDDDLGFWVKPRSTTWFSRFLLDQYDDHRWVKMFWMNKPAMFALADLLKLHVQKQDTKYRLVVPVLIRIACTLFKLSHGASLFICSEMFAVGKSTVSMMLREVVHAINEVLWHEIAWPTGQRLLDTQADFRRLCGLPAVVGAIDGTHVSISKPKFGPVDYFYFKSGGYLLNCQAVVDSNKCFLDLYLGMPGSTNDARVLRRSSLYQKAMHNNLFDNRYAVDGFSPFLLGDSGYPLLPWLMVLHRGHGILPVADTLFNKKLRRDRGVVENAFGILKQTFRELLVKSDLHVAFLPDVIMCYALLYSLLLRQSHEEVQRLLEVLCMEGLDREVLHDDPLPTDVGEAVMDNATTEQGSLTRTDLGIYLALQRQNGPWLRYTFLERICSYCFQLMFPLLKILESAVVYFGNSHAHLQLLLTQEHCKYVR